MDLMSARTSIRQALLAALVALWCSACAATERDFDVVLAGGRVIDPETGLDAVRNVGIRGDSIVRIATEQLRGMRTIDVTGLVVAPGFIDLHQHSQDQAAYRTMALDGITTALDLENGVPDIRRFIEARRGRSPIHFGAAASHRAARMLAWNLPLPASLDGAEAGIPAPPPGSVTDDAASPARLDQILRALRDQLDAGALGIGMGLEYLPGTTRHEVIRVFELAARYGVPLFIHARSAGAREPGSSVEALNELIGAAAISGASLHIVHINSTCLRDAPVCLSMIAGARARGLDVTTEAYPYTAAMTVINSAFFSPGWRERRGIDYGDLELPETGERLTQQRFDMLHRGSEARRVLIHMNPDSVVDAIVADSLVAIASDGLTAHPRGAGSHARVLARYVRDQGTIGLHEAVRKMSLMPAQRLETALPDARRLGRLQPGSRADIVIFDAATIQDRATFRNSKETSAGVRYLLVAGTVVVDEGRVSEHVAPGIPVVRSASSRK